VNPLGLVAAGGPLLILVVALFDLWCILADKLTPGQFIQGWAHDHPFLAALLTGFVGAFGAHIFWHS
jgi:hypothetical protein